MSKQTKNKSKSKVHHVKRPGSGRTKGSFSFVRLTLAELNAKLGADPTTPITVGRVWAQGLGFNVASTTNANALYEEIAGTTPSTKVGAVVVNLDGDEDAPATAEGVMETAMTENK